MESKKDIRKRVLALRNSLADEEIAAGSRAIVGRLTALPAMVGASTVMVFLSFGSEVRTDELIRWGWGQGKRIVVPLCKPASKELIPCRIDAFDELEAGCYGIREPKAGLVRPVPDREIDAVIVPALAFDRRGYRIGYGGGYYDRFLPRIPQAARIGVAFACQIVAAVPADSHDLPVEKIVTDAETLVARENS